MPNFVYFHLFINLHTHSFLDFILILYKDVCSFTYRHTIYHIEWTFVHGIYCLDALFLKKPDT